MSNRIINTFLLTVLFSGLIICGGRVVIDVFAADTDITAPTLQSVVTPSIVYTGSFFNVTLTATDDFSEIEVANIILEGPSGVTVLHAEITSVNYSNTKIYNILMPVSAETGTWKVKSVYLADDSGNTRTLYYGNQINYTFLVQTGTGTAQSTAATCTSFTYGNWWSCQSDGKQLRAIASASPLNCVGGNPVLAQSCTYAYQCGTNASLSRTNCINSRGVWDANICNCVCSTGYHFEGSGCLYTTVSLPACTDANYTAWSACQTNNTKTRTLLSTANCSGSLTTSQSCTYSATLPACTDADYSPWSACQTNNTKTRTLLYNANCSGSLATSQSCTYSANPPACTTADYTAWTACENGKQTRTLLATANCSGELSTSQTCSSVPFCTDANYAAWSVCNADGTKTRALLTNANCVGAAIQTQACSSSCGTDTVLNDQKKNHCISGNITGTWDEVNCICDCPTGYNFGETGCSINQSTCTAFTYSDWTECVSGKQSRIISTKFPTGCTGGSPEALSRYCIVSETCVKDDWICGEWSECSAGVQKRTCTLSKDCPNVVTESPKTQQTCVISTTAPECQYTYTDWGTCVNKMQYREIATRSPEGCKDVATESLSRICTSSGSCQFTYTDWSNCTNGKRTREVISKYPTTCTDNPILEETCQTASVSDDCLMIGWNTASDCGVYTYREKILSDCKTRNLTTFDSCRQYILESGKPDKCNELSGIACDNLIDNVILSGFNDTMSAYVKEQLYSISGDTGVINTQERTVIVQVPSAVAGITENKEVKIEAMPIASTDSGEISVKLISTSSVSSQESLSPVGISFDTDGDGLPDDVEKRLGTDINKKDTDNDGVDDNEELKNGTSPLDPLAKSTNIVLSGVDKALVDGKVLEQPKLASSTVSETLAVNSVQTVKVNQKNNIKFQGKAEPNKVITLFIYSVMPIVVTVQADSNGNWVYELDKTLVDGTHEAYVAINDDEGKIIETSLPTPFFIAQAEAVSVDNFVSTGDASQVSDKTSGMIILYVLGGLVVVFVLIAGILIIRQRYSE
ncbi:MAG: Ig-like domain-containing protein [Candidatus Paceibacterota bacterium]